MSSLTGKLPVPKALLWVGIVVALALIFPTAYNLLFAARDELSYSAGVQSTTCAGMLRRDAGPSTNCLTVYGIRLGNTGINPQPAIEVSLYNAPEPSRFSSNTVDIVASAERRQSPDVDYSSQGGQVRIRVENLQRNRLVELQLSYLGGAAYEQLQNASVDIRAVGTVIASNPHVTVLSRFVRNLTLLF